MLWMFWLLPEVVVGEQLTEVEEAQVDFYIVPHIQLPRNLIQ
jgi:hypothetical protein